MCAENRWHQKGMKMHNFVITLHYICGKVKESAEETGSDPAISMVTALTEPGWVPCDRRQGARFSRCRAARGSLTTETQLHAAIAG